MSPRPELRRGAALCALGLCLGCASSLDLERARELLRPEDSAEIPDLRRVPAAELPPPRSLRARSGELRAIPLEWDPVLAGEIGGYLVERAPAGSESFRPLAAVGGRFRTVYVDRGAPPESPVPGEPGAEDAVGDGTAFAYRIRPFDRAGRLSERASPPAEGRAAPPPAPPERLVAYSHLPRRVALAWSPSPGPHVAGYVVERSPSAGGPFDEIGRTGDRFDTVFVDRGLGDLRLFHYRVRAVSAAGGIGPPGEPVRAVTKPDPLPVHGLEAEPVGLGRVRIRFEPNVEPDIVGYRVLRIRADGSREPVAELPRDTTEVDDLAVGAGEELAYTAVAIDADGLESTPAPPVEVTAAGYGIELRPLAGGVEIRFDPRAEEGFHAARIYRVGRLRSKLLGTVTGGRFVDPEPPGPGRTVRYRVVLVGADDRTAPPSRVVSLRIPEGRPGPEATSQEPPHPAPAPSVSAPSEEPDPARGTLPARPSPR